MTTETALRPGSSLLTICINNMRENVISAIEDAQKNGLHVELPESIDVDLPLDIHGLPAGFGTRREEIAARLKTTLLLKRANSAD